MFEIAKYEEMIPTNLDELNNPTITEIQKEIIHYERIGMKPKVKELKEEIPLIAIATILSQKNMILLEKDDSYLGIIQTNGNRKYFRSRDGWKIPFQKTKLSKYEGNIPMEILEKLPDESAKKAVIFWREERDPIIAVKLKRNLYIGVFKWE